MDISIIFRIAAIGILTAVCAMILKKSDKDDIATLVSIAGLVIVIALVAEQISGLFETIRNLFMLF